MLESRVIKRCYPRLSVPSHLYTRNAYVEREREETLSLRLARGVFLPSLKLAGIDGPGDVLRRIKRSLLERRGCINNFNARELTDIRRLFPLR